MLSNPRTQVKDTLKYISSSIMHEKAQVTPDEYKRLNLKEFRDVTIWVIKLVLHYMPFHFTAYTIIQSLMGVRGLINWYIFAKTLDAIISSLQNPQPNLSAIYPYLLIMLGYNILSSVLSYFSNYYWNYIKNYSRQYIKQAFYTKLNDLGIQNLEQPYINNRVYRANEYISEVFPYVSSTIQFITEVVRMLISLFIIVSFLPSLAIVITLSALPYVLWDRKNRTKLYKFIFENTEDNRKSSMHANDLMASNKLQEIKITKSFYILDEKYISFKTWFNQNTIDLVKKWVLGSHISRVVSDIIVFLGYVKVFQNLIKGLISIGTVTFQIRTLNDFQDSLMSVMRKLNDLLESSVQLREFYLIFKTEQAFPDGTVSIPTLKQGPDVEFKNVWFKYPNTEKYVLEDLNLKIRSGERIAIVGHNGAGKTTMVKLMTRIYQTTQGEVLINDININKLKIDNLYSNMGVLFQEFNAYPQLSVKDNIYLGNPTKPPDESAIRQAAESADALGFIEEYPLKFETILSEKFKGGIRPSTGQWQKLALARFFYRNAPFVIFDEPTASIDAKSEYNIFNRIYGFFENKTVVIISHRFSTVRNADRIIVLDQGKIIEEGSHKELMNRNGKYAEAFLLQAQGYITDITSDSINGSLNKDE